MPRLSRHKYERQFGRTRLHTGGGCNDRATGTEPESRVLEDIEAIRGLRNKYFRCLDGRLWNEMAECFSDDVSAELLQWRIQVRGQECAAPVLRDGDDRRPHRHASRSPSRNRNNQRDNSQGYVGTIQLPQRQEEQPGQRSPRSYQDEYVKENGPVEIKSIACNQIFQENWDRNDIPSLKLTLRGTPESLPHRPGEPRSRGSGRGIICIDEERR